jgi:hypothetical protein
MITWQSTAKHGKACAPFENADNLCSETNSIMHGRSTWSSFDVTHTGEDCHRPGAPLWKHASHKVYALDTHKVLVLQLASLDLDGHYDYLAHKASEQQHNGTWEPKYTDLMSGDWAWNKLVCFHLPLC